MKDGSYAAEWEQKQGDSEEARDIQKYNRDGLED